MGYSSEDQLSYSLSATWPAAKSTFTTAGFTYSRTPVSTLDTSDTFYQLSGGAGYTSESFGFDGALSVSRAPISQTYALGGYLGLTYAMLEPIEVRHDLRAAGNRRRFLQDKPDYRAIFWTRLTYAVTAMESKLLAEPNDSGKQGAINIDFYLPRSAELTWATSLSFYNYYDPEGFFATSFQTATNANLQLLGSTLQSLPHTSVAVHLIWQPGARDALLPRYQVTEMELSRHWSHTVDLSWRHELNKHWTITPTYEASYQDSQLFTGLMLEINYLP